MGLTLRACLEPENMVQAAAAHELTRLNILNRYGLLDTPAEEAYDDLTQLAAQICETPVALVTLLDDHRQWFKSRVGVDMIQLPREISFCRFALQSSDLLLVPDAARDPRFADNPLVTGPPCVRFYAGAPLVSPDGYVLGTLCVIDTRPRQLSEAQQQTLRTLSRHVVTQMELRRRLAELDQADLARRRAEDERRRTEREGSNLLRAVIEGTNDAIFAKDRQGRYVLVNSAAARHIGKPREEVLGKRDDELFAPEVALQTRANDLRILTTGLPETYEDTEFHSDGSRTFLSSKAVYRDSNTEIAGIIGLSRDITARKEAETALRQAEENYRSIIENAVEGMFRSAPHGGFLSANPALARMLGYESPEQVLQEVYDLGEQVYADPQQRAEFLLLLQAQGQVAAFELQVRRRDGEKIWVSLSARIVNHRETPGAFFVEGSAVDITASKQAEKALHESEARFRRAFDDAPIGMCLVDLQGRFLQVNRALCDLVGYTEAEMGGMPFVQITHPDDVDADLRQHRQMSKGQISGYAMEKRYFHKAGHIVWIQLNVSLVCDDKGRPLHHIAQIQNITQRRALEEEQERLLMQTEDLLTEALERADRDPLTGLLNHRSFHKRLEEECARAQKTGQSVAVAMLDLDNFKFFNDAYGHLTGDDVLRRAATALSHNCRECDTVARFGGDEFALLMPGLDSAGAGAVIAQMTAALDQMGFRPQGADVAIPLCLSAGIAIYPDDARTRLEAVERADERLRRAKSGGAEDDGAADQTRAFAARSIEGFTLLDALVTAVDNKDRYTRRHSEDVLEYSLGIARVLGLDERAQHTVSVAALLHDVGKIGVPDHILRKPGRLSDAEFDAIRQHPMMGAIIVGAVPGLEETLDAVRHHHERWDGDGYPFGLRGEETPLIARIMAVADAFSAMTTDRPYRKGMPHEKACAILKEGAGVQWDARCVEAFLQTRIA